MSISHELGRLTLMNRGQVNIPFPDILIHVLDACTYNPEFSIDFDRIKIPQEPLILRWDLPGGRFWWTWQDDSEAKDTAEWWRHPSLPQVFPLICAVSSRLTWGQNYEMIRISTVELESALGEMKEAIQAVNYQKQLSSEAMDIYHILIKQMKEDKEDQTEGSSTWLYWIPVAWWNWFDVMWLHITTISFL